MHAAVRPTLTLFLILASAVASAQEPRVYLAAKAGSTFENSEDNLTGTVPALGLSATVPFTSKWRGEFEFWLPGYLEDARGEPKHRDVLYSFAAVRVFDTGRARPFVAFGVTLSRTEDRFTLCSADRVPPGGGAPVRALVSCDEPDVIDVQREKHVGTSVYLLAGAGLEIAIARRVSLVADVRVNLAPVSVLVRPGLGVVARW